MDETDQFQALVLSNLDSLYSFALTLTHEGAAAEDLLQETLLKAFRAFKSFQPDLSFKAWVFAIMKHASIDKARRRRARPLEEPLDAEELDPGQAEEPGDAAIIASLWTPPLDPETLLVRRLTIEDVREAITRLPAVFREVIQLREIEGLSYQDVASVIGCPIGTVMSRLSRARTMVRRALRERSEIVKPRNAHGL